MGGCCSCDADDDDHPHRPLDYGTNGKRPSHQVGVGLGVAMMMQQAGALLGAQHPHVDVAQLEGQIRKAKAEGRTVTLFPNGTLYFDYQFVAQIPPHYDLCV
ncbi:hypothetical protein QR680_017275 [Steinernema hermaphroditum]|uniref:Uncharacterized protein n=1 Tax=Steinernema hermaphroditum TaxID=289476 RepID=A0AA39HDY9_9BILA|nr:hypothetical protein QR680_017275 [Steinernema hermaphroditum]